MLDIVGGFVVILAIMTWVENWQEDNKKKEARLESRHRELMRSNAKLAAAATEELAKKEP